MNYNIKTIRDALSAACGVSQELMHDALAALAELERAAAQKFEAPEVDDAMAHRIAEDVFNALDEGRVCADDGRKMIAAVRSGLGPTLGLVEIREPTPEECADMAEWFKSECQACCINQQESVDYGRAIFDAVKIVIFPQKSEVGL